MVSLGRGTLAERAGNAQFKRSWSRGQRGGNVDDQKKRGKKRHGEWDDHKGGVSLPFTDALVK